MDTLEYKTMPKPNIPEKTTPIIVSCLILLFSLKNPDATAQIIPEQKAPISNGICNKYDIIYVQIYFYENQALQHCTLTSYIANLVVEYVSCLRRDAESPLYSANTP